MATRKDSVYPSIDQVLSDVDGRMSKALEATKRELNSIRTGRASSALVEEVMVDYYGVPTPIRQLASISVAEARLIVIQPWDKQALSSIEKSLMKSDLGFNPSNDGTVIRLPVPPLSQERRLELVKLLKRRIEEGKIAVRNVRRDSLDQLRDMERNKAISQDDDRRAQERLQKTTDLHIAQMDQLLTVKEAEIMQV